MNIISDLCEITEAAINLQGLVFLRKIKLFIWASAALCRTSVPEPKKRPQIVVLKVLGKLTFRHVKVKVSNTGSKSALSAIAFRI